MKRVLCLFLLVGALAAFPSTASAQTGEKDYERGNAPAYVDVTGLSVSNGEKRVEMVAKVRRLSYRGVFDFTYWAGRRGSPPSRSVIVVVHRTDGEVGGRVLACGREDCRPMPCPDLKILWSQGLDEVKAILPQACFPGTQGAPDVGRFSVDARAGSARDTEFPGHLLLKRG